METFAHDKLASFPQKDINELAEVFEQLQLARDETTRLSEHFNDRNESLYEVVTVVENAIFQAEDHVAAIRKRIEKRTGHEPTPFERSKLEELRLRIPVLWNLRSLIAEKRETLNQFVDATVSFTTLAGQAMDIFQGMYRMNNKAPEQSPSTQLAITANPQPLSRPQEPHELKTRSETQEHLRTQSESASLKQTGHDHATQDRKTKFRNLPRHHKSTANDIVCHQPPRETSNEVLVQLERRNTECRIAERELLNHWTTYEDQFKKYFIRRVHCHDADLRSEFAPMYVSRGRELAQKLATAERDVVIAKRIVKASRTPNTPYQESHFVSDPGDGVGKEYQEDAEMCTDMDCIEEWKKSSKTSDYKRTASEANFHGGGRLKDVEISDSVSAVEEVAHKKRKIVAWEKKKPQPFEIPPVVKPPEADGITKPSDFDANGNPIMPDGIAGNAPDLHFGSGHNQWSDMQQRRRLEAKVYDKLHTIQRPQRDHHEDNNCTK